jgi:hypothetical protein
VGSCAPQLWPQLWSTAVRGCTAQLWAPTRHASRAPWSTCRRSCAVAAPCRRPSRTVGGPSAPPKRQHPARAPSRYPHRHSQHRFRRAALPGARGGSRRPLLPRVAACRCAHTRVRPPRFAAPCTATPDALTCLPCTDAHPLHPPVCAAAGTRPQIYGSRLAPPPLAAAARAAGPVAVVAAAGARGRAAAWRTAGLRCRAGLGGHAAGAAAGPPGRRRWPPPPERPGLWPSWLL